MRNYLNIAGYRGVSNPCLMRSKRLPVKTAGFVLMTGLLLSFMSSPLFAASKHDIKQLIGKTVIGKNYPGGWKWEGDEVVGGCERCMDVGLTKLRKGKTFAIVSDKDVSTNRQYPAPLHFEVLDGILLNVDPGDGQRWSELCEVKGQKKLPETTIVAEVYFGHCQQFTTRVLRAWRLHIPSGKFTPIPTKGITCEYWLFGQEPLTETCPGANEQ